ncbi:hypothetical protein C1637_13585 [Chryseobacterium lactis]|uniref:T9SS C-terminal target domain-containing protein n=1 Tax=Chryseobacterium lactis TaxID=1241981 RepID=A0A3G6RML9_CHRLC|nr:T9SS type A sorting domain-containing protein [Chryseobacterium lactis]AZA83842.1 T9SS C-terminal target domain-containing protein [Chryseobacterium lactis]AZB04227.1 T9SS C-terminal target domain-containing protein [Chryseobacterium lactis]PNW12865.1 hypothetical protein C1637_13585 [Chryseobacterium lactis]
MRKKLFFATALVIAFSTSAQVLESDNYNSYTVGNVTNSMTTVGQGGMRVLSGTISDYKIVAGNASHGNYLQVTGGSDATDASTRYVLKDNGLPWATRIAGNNIIKESLDIFTGTATNQHVSGVYILNSDYDGIIGIYYDSQSRSIIAGARLNNNGQPGYYIFTITAATTQYPANTWINVGCIYNKTTGEVMYKIGNVTYGPMTFTGLTTVSGLDPAFHVVQNTFTTGSTNAGPTTFGIDNYRVEASNDTTLGTSEIKVSKASIIAIGPNPTADYLNILTDLKINKAEIFDMSGRKIDLRLDGNKIDVKSLNPGSYIINVETKEGKTSSKFIKK